MFGVKIYRGLRRAAIRMRPRACADEALLAFLVATIHSATAPLAASMVMAMLITLAAYQVTGATIFLGLALAHIFIGAGRLERLALYRAYERAGLTKRDVVACVTTQALFPRTGRDLRARTFADSRIGWIAMTCSGSARTN